MVSGVSDWGYYAPHLPSSSTAGGGAFDTQKAFDSPVLSIIGQNTPYQYNPQYL
jgi:hypothetical protein